MGSGGEVTSEYANLIKEIWKGSDDKIYPAKLIKILQQHASHVSNYRNSNFLVNMWLTIRCSRILSLPSRLLA